MRAGLSTCRTIYVQERLSDFSTARDHLLCSYSKPLCDCVFHRLSQPGLTVVSRELYIGVCMKTSEKRRRLSQPGLTVVSRELYIGACMKKSEKRRRLSQPGLTAVSRELYIGAYMKTSKKRREGNIYPINSSFSQYKLRAPESQSVKNKFLNLLEALFQ